MSNYDAWLRDLRAARKGGLRFPQLAIDRGLNYEKTLSFGMDLSADDFFASLALDPDTEPLVDFTVTVGPYADSATTVTLSLSDTQTAALPADGDFDGSLDLVFDLLRSTGGSGPRTRFMAGVIPVIGKVTDAS